MSPSFEEMILDLALTEGFRIYKSAQEGEWGIIKDGMFLMKVDSSNPSEEFLLLWINS